MADGARGVNLVEVELRDERLAELLQDYMREWSHMIEVPVGDDGRFVFHHELPAGSMAFLFAEGYCGGTVGFVIVAPYGDGSWSVEEFFVIPQARRRGVGVMAARTVFAWHAGRWTLTIRPENPGALGFWRRAMPEAVEREEPGEDGIVRTRMTLAAS
jgi:predicted acetyltransferase